MIFHLHPQNHPKKMLKFELWSALDKFEGINTVTRSNQAFCRKLGSGLDQVKTEKCFDDSAGMKAYIQIITNPHIIALVSWPQ